MTQPAPSNTINRRLLFLVSVLALATAGISFGIRAAIAENIRTAFFDPIDKLHSNEMIGAVMGVVFLGFALTIAIGSPLLDYIGMGRLLALSGFCFVAGTLIVVNCDKIATPESIYRVTWLGMLVIGIGQGLVETVINPLAATLYPDEKTAKLNVLHAWWPGGIIIGGVLGYFLGKMHVPWQITLGLTILPSALFGGMALLQKFPPTERVAFGVSFGGMFKELLRPFFFVWFASMFLTAASELAPGQWVDLALSRTTGMQGILLLIYVSALMFVMRHFAGPLAHRLSPVGLLWFSCALASLGLVGLSFADSPVLALAAATVWGTGVCYMWPTMLAAASERFPRGGALLMGLMGTAGTASIYFVLPMMGRVFDNRKIELAGGESAFKALAGPELNRILGLASQYSFRVVAILPAVLLAVFGAIYLYDRARGGFKPEKLGVAPAAAESESGLSATARG